MDKENGSFRSAAYFDSEEAARERGIAEKVVPVPNQYDARLSQRKTSRVIPVRGGVTQRFVDSRGLTNTILIQRIRRRSLVQGLIFGTILGLGIAEIVHFTLTKTPAQSSKP